MSTALVLTLIGPDRPGLVDAIARIAHEHGASWQGSHMARLAGRFAGVLHLDVPDRQVDALTAALGAEGELGLHVVIEPGLGDDPATGARISVRLTIVAGDRPGIVHEVAEAIAAAGANVESLETECAVAPHCGGGLFHASALVSLPAPSGVEALRAALERVGDDLIVDMDADEEKPRQAPLAVA